MTRPQVLRAGNAARCCACGRPLRPVRASRRQRYCSYRCRDEARRTRNFVLSGGTRYPSKGIPRSAENNSIQSGGYCRNFGDGVPRLNVAPRGVIEREIVGFTEWVAIVSPDGITCMVAITGSGRD